jgi:hypothetical protein
MDQRSDDIRQDIESTRAALDEKLDSLESKARQTFDLKHQVSERPWMMLGAAVATGYVLGSLGSDDHHTDARPYADTYSQATPQHYASATRPAPQHEQPKADGFLAQFDDEIEMLKTAAIATLTGFLRDSIREYVPALGRQLDAEADKRGYTPSSAPNTSFSAASGANYEQIPETTSYGPNTVSRNSAQGQPYYPPGASPATSHTDYASTYQSPTPAERSVGDESIR